MPELHQLSRSRSRSRLDGMGRRLAVGDPVGAEVLAWCRTGPVNSDPMPLRADRCGPAPHRVRTSRAGQSPGRHRAGTGPGRDKPGDPAANGVTAEPGPATGTGKDPELSTPVCRTGLGKFWPHAAPGRGDKPTRAPATRSRGTGEQSGSAGMTWPPCARRRWRGDAGRGAAIARTCVAVCGAQEAARR